MAYNKTLHEILSTHVWMMEDVAFRHYQDVVKGNIEARVPLAQLLFDNKAENGLLAITNQGRKFYTTLQGGIATLQEGVAALKEGVATMQRDNDATPECNGILEENEEIVKTILVLHAEGPITRNGGECSYGSIDHRNLMLMAADDDDCMGVLFHVNTPGGSAEGLRDYKMGFEAMRNAGKRSIALVDGKACSLGIVITCQCDYTLAINPDDELGCIGSMMAGDIAPDGAINTIDGERHISIVATQSPDKNRAIREAANGDYTLLQQECDEACNDFLSLIDTCRPQILPEHRTGNTYKASTVIGSLCDGIGTEDDCLAYLVDGVTTWQRSNEGNAAEGNGNEGDATSQRGNEATPVSGDQSPDDKCNPKKHNTSMNIQNICNALAINAEDMHTEENGFFLNEAHVDALDSALATANARIAELEAAAAVSSDASLELNESLATANARIAELEGAAEAAATQHTADMEALNTEHANAIEALNTEHASALETVNARIAELEAAAETAATEHTAALETANARIAELEAENTELAAASAPAAKPEPVAQAAAPAAAKKTYAQCDTLDEKKKHSIYA